MRIPLTSPLLTLVLGLGPVITPADAAELGDQAGRYHNLLQKRPSADSLFQRFLDVALSEIRIAELEDILREQAQNPTDQLILARFLEQIGRDTEARERYLVLLPESPDQATIHLRLADLASRQLDFSSAEAHARQAAELAGDADTRSLEAAMRLRARMLVRLGQGDAAVAQVRDLTRRMPDDEVLQEDLVELLADEGLYDQAISLGQGLAARSQGARAVQLQLRLGELQLAGGKREQALQTYRSTLNRAGQGSWLERQVLASIERCFRREDDLTGLVEEMQQLATAHPARLGLQRRLAELQWENGAGDQAVKTLQALLQRAPTDQQLRLNLATLLAQNERLDEAITLAEQLQTTDTDARFQLADWYYRAGRLKQANHLLQDLASQDDHARLRAIRLSTQHHDTETSAALFAVNTPSPSLLEARAENALARDQLDTALADIDRLLQADPQALARAADILAAAEQHQAAFALLRQHLDPNDALLLDRLLENGLSAKQFDALTQPLRQRLQLITEPAQLQTPLRLGLRLLRHHPDRDALVGTLSQSDHPAEVALAVAWHASEKQWQEAEAALPADPAFNGQLSIRLATQQHDWMKLVTLLETELASIARPRADHYRQLAEAYSRCGRLSDATAITERWRQEHPQDEAAWLLAANSLVQQQQNEAAIDLLRQAVQRLDTPTQALAQLARQLQNNGAYEDAERCWWRLYDDGEQASEQLRWVASLVGNAQLRGREDALIQAFEQRARSNPGSSTPLLALAEIHGHLNEGGKQRQALLRASRRRGDDPELLRRIARLALDEGDYPQAELVLRQALDLKAEASTRRMLAEVLFDMGKESAAVDLLRQALFDADNDPQRCAEDLAILLLDASLPEAALAEIDRSIRSHGPSHRLLYLQALCAWEIGDNDRVIKLLVDAWQLPGEPYDPNQAAQQNQILPSFADFIMTSIPPGTWEVFGRQELSRQIRPENHRHMPQSNQRWLPSDRDTLRSAVLLWIGYIGRDWNPENSDAKIQLLPIDLQEDARIQIALDRENLFELQQQKPEDATLASLLLMINLHEQQTITQECARDLLQLLSPDWPFPAFLASLFLVDSENDRPAVLQAISSFEFNQHTAIWGSMLLLELIKDQHHTPALRGRVVPPEIAEIAQQRLQQEFNTIIEHQQGPNRWMLFQVAPPLLAKMLESEQYDQAIDFLLILYQQDTAAQHHSPFPFRHHQSAISELPEWPNSWADLPGILAACLQTHSHFRSVDIPIESWQTLLASERDIPEFLRVLLAIKAEASDATPRLAAFLQAHPSHSDARLLTAGFSAAAGDHQQVVEHLQLLQHQTLHRDLRRRLDGALLAHALRCEPRDDELALSAARRMGRHSLQGGDHQVLMQAFEDLGKQQLAANLAQRPVVGNHQQQLIRRDIRERLEKMLQADNRDGAIRLATQEIRTACRQLINQKSFFYRGHEISNLLQACKKQGLTEAILTTWQEKSNSPRALASFALGAELFDHRQLARQSYTQTLEQMPRQLGVRARLMAMLSDDEPDRALELWLELGQRERDTLGPLLVECMALNDYQFPTLQNPGLPELLPRLIEADAQPGEWTLPAVDRLVWKADQDLYDPDNHTETLSEADLKRQGTVRDSSEQLCRHSAYADAAFSRWLSTWPLAERWHERAIQMALVAGAHAPGPALSSRHINGSQKSPLAYRPATYLYAAAHQIGQPERWAQEFKPALHTRQRVPADFEQLYQKDPPDLTATRHLDNRYESYDDVLIDAILWHEETDLLVSGFRARLNKIDLSGYQALNSLCSWFPILRQHLEQASIDALWGDIFRHFLGDDPEQWNNQVTQDLQGGYNWNLISYRFAHALRQFLDKRPSEFAAIISHLQRVPKLIEAGNLQYSLRNQYTPLLAEDDIGTLKGQIDRIGLINEATSFHTGFVPDWHETSLLVGLVNKLRRKQSLKQEMQNTLADDQRFGAQLLLALLEKDNDQVAELLASQLDRLQDKPISTQANLLKSLTALDFPLAHPHEDLQAWLQTALHQLSDQKYQEWSHRDPDGWNDYSYKRDSAEIISLLLKAGQADHAEQVYRQAFGKMRAKAGANDRLKGDAANIILEKLLEEHRSQATLRFALRHLYDPELNISWDDQIHGEIVRGIRSECSNDAEWAQLAKAIAPLFEGEPLILAPLLSGIIGKLDIDHPDAPMPAVLQLAKADKQNQTDETTRTAALAIATDQRYSEHARLHAMAKLGNIFRPAEAKASWQEAILPLVDAGLSSTHALDDDLLDDLIKDLDHHAIASIAAALRAYIHRHGDVDLDDEQAQKLLRIAIDLDDTDLRQALLANDDYALCRYPDNLALCLRILPIETMPAVLRNGLPQLTFRFGKKFDQDLANHLPALREHMAEQPDLLMTSLIVLNSLADRQGNSQRRERITALVQEAAAIPEWNKDLALTAALVVSHVALLDQVPSHILTIATDGSDLTRLLLQNHPNRREILRAGLQPAITVLTNNDLTAITEAFERSYQAYTSNNDYAARRRLENFIVSLDPLLWQHDWWQQHPEAQMTLLKWSQQLSRHRNMGSESRQLFTTALSHASASGNADLLSQALSDITEQDRKRFFQGHGSQFFRSVATAVSMNPAQSQAFVDTMRQQLSQHQVAKHFSTCGCSWDLEELADQDHNLARILIDLASIAAEQHERSFHWAEVAALQTLIDDKPAAIASYRQAIARAKDDDPVGKWESALSELEAEHEP